MPDSDPRELEDNKLRLQDATFVAICYAAAESKYTAKGHSIWCVPPCTLGYPSGFETLGRTCHLFSLLCLPWVPLSLT